jgi:glucan phosphoethanolaminetransferase (alkaline phosphatase superfamily)
MVEGNILNWMAVPISLIFFFNIHCYIIRPSKCTLVFSSQVISWLKLGGKFFMTHWMGCHSLQVWLFVLFILYLESPFPMTTLICKGWWILSHSELWLAQMPWHFKIIILFLLVVDWIIWYEHYALYCLNKSANLMRLAISTTISNPEDLLHVSFYRCPEHCSCNMMQASYTVKLLCVV